MANKERNLGNVTLARYLKNRLPVFLFHEIGEKPSEFHRMAGTFIELQKFEELLNWISRTFIVRSLDALLSGQPVAPNSCVLTFDDSWKGALTWGPELLAKRQMPATFFLNSSVLDGAPDLAAYAYLTNPGQTWPTATVNDQIKVSSESPNIRSFSGETASWNDVKKLNSSLFTLGNHLYWHSNVMTGSLADFEQNYFKNRDRLSEYGNYREILAFPYGRQEKHFDLTHIQKSTELGVLKAFSSNAGTNTRRTQFLLRRTAPSFSSSPEEILRQLVDADIRRFLTNK